MPDDPAQASDDNLVVVLSSDLFFAMRISSALRSMSYHANVTKTVDDFGVALAEGEAVLALIDFNHPLDWDKVRGILAGSSVPTIAFGPHKDTDGFAAAKAAGAQRVVANGVFTKRLPDLVERLALRRRVE